MIEELVRKFFDGNCTPEDKLKIVEYFQENPEKIEGFFSEQEWESFDNDKTLNEDVSERMRYNIQRSIKSPKVFPIKNWMAAAAGLLIFMSIGVKYFLKDKVELKSKNNRIVSPYISITNHSDTIMFVQLPDSSHVNLMPNSKIAYTTSYGLIKRDINLTGEAIFKVTKNKAKPFTVYSSEISTTALGTKFKVTAFSNSTIVKVHLYEGKVVVKRTNNQSNPYYLLPGDRLVFNRLTLATNVLLSDKRNTTSGHQANNNTSSTAWYMFNNQNLTQVFDQIEDIYNVKIYYSDNDISNIRFIGKIEKSDSISVILKDIAKMNNLIFTQKGDIYSIKKKK